MKTDICLILEGTYPYVAGGVSTWIAQILEYMPQLTFSILYIGASHDPTQKYKYTLPPNVVELREIYLHDLPPPRRQHKKDIKSESFWQTIKQFQRDILEAAPLDVQAISEALKQVHSTEHLVYLMTQSKHSWDMIVELYKEEAPADASFLDFFWTHRYINLPVLNLLRTELPEACLYHAACTGYAGLLGALAYHTTLTPFMLTEHGIYTRERRIEIFNAEWILGSGSEAFLDIARLESFFKNCWTNFFESMSRAAYQAAQQITTLFEANRIAQERDGAPAARIQIIPNGINTKELLALPPKRRASTDKFSIGFVGRITAIKDIKNLLRALSILKTYDIDFEIYMIGPLDEEPDYVDECQTMIENLNLAEHIIFTGRVDVKEYYPRIDVLILTSISEGQPFVILEAQCAGVPVVSTDVGACPELLLGRTEEDKEIGPSGLLTSVASPDETAKALAHIALHPEEAAEMGDNGRERAMIHYDIRNVMHQYLEQYENHLYSRGR